MDSALLSQIQKGKGLRKTQTNDRSQAQGVGASTPPAAARFSLPPTPTLARGARSRRKRSPSHCEKH